MIAILCKINESVPGKLTLDVVEELQTDTVPIYIHYNPDTKETVHKVPHMSEKIEVYKFIRPLTSTTQRIGLYLEV